MRSATATFLFTDIEGSTQLLRSHRGDYARILADHHRVLREAFGAHGGREVDNQGDSFFIAFLRARDAVLAAAAAQRALAAHEWPGGANVRVRMGVHTGEADLAVDRYVGLSVHRAARISAAAHGGQVLVSQTTAGLVEDEEDLPGLALRDLGEHRLKDLARPVRLHQLEIDGLPRSFPPLKVGDAPKPQRRKRAALIAAPLALLLMAAAAVLALTSRDPAPPTVLPNSLVRLDPDTLAPTKVVRIGRAPDILLAAGGFLWITHHVLRDIDSGALRDAGDRTLTRVDPSTDDVVTVGGGLAPCGLAADPSGDVWVANCFPSPSGGGANVVRVDASSLNFEATWPVPGGDGFFRGLAYGDGSLWISDIRGGDILPSRKFVTRLDPRTGQQQTIVLERRASALAWADGYGDLWLSNFFDRSVTRLHPATRDVETIEEAGIEPAVSAVEGEAVWVGDWAAPRVARLRAVGARRPRMIALPTQNPGAGVWGVTAGEGAIWAATPRDDTIWRIDPRSEDVTRIGVPHLPAWVAPTGDGIWVVVRGAEEP